VTGQCLPSLTPLAALPRLERLKLEWFDPGTLGALRALPRLTSLSLGPSDCSGTGQVALDEMAKGLPVLPALERLALRGRGGQAWAMGQDGPAKEDVMALDGLERQPRLERLLIDARGGVVALDAVGRSTVVSLTLVRTYVASLTPLRGKQPPLEQLVLPTGCSEDGSAEPESCAPLAEHEWFGSEGRGGSWPAGSYLHRLRLLDLGGTEVSHLDFLVRLPALEVFRGARMKVNPFHAEHRLDPLRAPTHPCVVDLRRLVMAGFNDVCADGLECDGHGRCHKRGPALEQLDEYYQRHCPRRCSDGCRVIYECAGDGSMYEREEKERKEPSRSGEGG